MSYKYNNVVIKPGLYLGDQVGLNGDNGASSPIFSSMQLSLATNGLSRRDDNFFVLPGYKAILYKNTDMSYITVYTIDNTTGTDIKGVWNDVYNSNVANQISKVDLFYNNVKIDYSNIKTMGFKAAARLCWGAKLGEHSDGSYNKYALVLESSTPKFNNIANGTSVVETTALIGINRPYLSLPWVEKITATKASHSFWWCSKGFESGLGNSDISYAFSYAGPYTTYSYGTILNLINNNSNYTQIFLINTKNLSFYIRNNTVEKAYTSSKNICDGLWHHIVWNIDNTTWKIYTDGVEESVSDGASYAMNSALNNNTTQIGARGFTANDQQTNGYIADYRFYKNTLSPTEINGLLNGDHTYKTTLDVSSCLFQYTFDPDAVYTNNYTTYAIGAATVPYAAELRNGADIMLPSMDLTDSLGKNIKIYPFTIGSNGFSISFWWRSDGLWATQGANSRLFYLGNGDETTNITFSLEIGTNGYPSIGVTSTTQNLTTLTDFSDDTWKHVVWTMTPESTWKLYVNNALINTYTGMAYPDVIQRSTNYIGSGYLTTDKYPCGYIGDFRMYNATLSSDNVNSLYNQTDTNNNEINLIQHYDFVEETMNANNKILYSNAPKYALELTNSAATTGSAGQYGSMASGLDATGTNGLTFSFWWKSKGDYSNQGGWSRIFDFADNTSGENSIMFACKYGSNLYPSIEMNRGTNRTSGFLSSLTDFCDGDWKHVVWTMTSATTQTSTWNLYVNNKRYGLGNLTTTGWYPNDKTRTNCFIGKSWAVNDGYLNGYISDVRVYGEVFTWQKITDLYNNVYTDTTNLLLHTIYPSKTAPTLVNSAKIPITSSKTELTNTTQTRESSYYKLDVSGGSYAQSNGPLTIITNDGVSFAFWFKPTATQGALNPMIFDFGKGEANDNIFFGKNSTSNAPYIRIYQGSTGRDNFTLSNNSTFFSEQVWKHVVWTMTYSAGITSTWNVYIDGQQYGGAPLTTTGYYPNSLARTYNYIGKSSWTNDGITYGQIADFRVYNSVLNLRNVNDLYNGRYTDNTSLFLNYPIDTVGTTNPNTISIIKYGSNATITQETITVTYKTPPPTSLYLATDPALNYHRGSYLSLPPLVKPGTNGLSFSIWWRAGETYANQGPWARLFSFSNGKNRDAIEFILNTSTLGYPTLQVHNGIKFGDNAVTSITSLCDGFWKHIVWTMTYCAPTQTASTWIVYVNGTATSVTATGTYPNNVSRKYAYIGQSAWIQNMYPTGDFADFRVYGAVLTQANVDSLYALTDTTDKEANLLLRQKFDSTESYLYQTCDNIKPSVLFENDPSITNTPTGQHVVLPTLPGLLSTDVPDRRGISISFWWKSKGLSGTGGRLFESGFAESNDVLLLRTRSGLDTYMNAQFYYGTGVADTDVVFAATDGDIENLENGEWHHIVWTMSFEGNSLNSYWKFYMDGYFIKTGYLSNAYLDAVNNTYTVRQVNNFIGRSNWASATGCLNGYMSDFRIYNNCLTIQDVGDLYTNTYDDNSDLFLRYSFEKKIKIENVFNYSIYTNDDYNKLINSTNKTLTISFSANVTIENSITDHPKGITTAMNTGASGGYGQLSTLTNGNNGMTFSFWFKPTGTHGVAARIFDFGNGQNSENIFIWKSSTADNYPQVKLIKASSDTTTISLTTLTDFFSNQVWKHMVWTMTYSTSNTSTWNLYYNGASTSVTTNSYYPVVGTRTNNYLGKSNWTIDGALQGMLTDFRIYNRTLTGAEATALYNNTYVSTADLYFSTNFALNVPQFYTPSHSTDTTQVARLYNGATLSTDTYKFGTSSLFLSNYSTTTNVVYTSGPGFGQCMQTIAPLPKLGTNGISFSFWWKSAGPQGSSSILFDFAEDANNRITFYDVSNNSTSPIVQLLTGNGTKYDYNLNKTEFNNGDWHHIVWNIDKYNNTWEIFFDNVSSGTQSSKMYPENVSRSFCFFGRSSVAAELYANGYIDEFRIHSKVLTATDVSNLYNNIDSTSLKDNLILYYSFNQDACRNVMDEQYLDNNVIDTPIFNT